MTTRSLQQLGLALLRYADDPTLWHSRLLLRSVAQPTEPEHRDWRMVPTPDRDMYPLSLSEGAARSAEAVGPDFRVAPWRGASAVLPPRGWRWSVQPGGGV